MPAKRPLPYYKQNRLQQLRGFCSRRASRQHLEGRRKAVPQPAQRVAADPGAGARAEDAALRAPRAQDHAHARRQNAVRPGRAADRPDRLARRHVRCTAGRRGNRAHRHCRRRIHHALPAAQVRTAVCREVSRRGPQAAQRHRTRWAGHGARRRGRLRRRLDARNARRHRLPADVLLRRRC